MRKMVPYLLTEIASMPVIRKIQCEHQNLIVPGALALPKGLDLKIIYGRG
jgi:hypothetical protein